MNLGLRLGKMVGQIGLVKLVQKYNFELVDTTPLEFDISSIMLQAKTAFGFERQSVIAKTLFVFRYHVHLLFRKIKNQINK